jgi:hypothetical protein
MTPYQRSSSSKALGFTGRRLFLAGPGLSFLD